MLQESVFDSGDLAVGDRFDAWCERMGSTHAPMRLESDHAADYRAHQRLIDLGAVSIWPTTFDQLVFVRTPELIRRSDPEVYHLSLVRAGAAKASWGESRAAYGVGDFHLNDSSRPYEIWTGQGPTSAVGVEIPKALLPLPARTVQQAVGRRLSAHAGLGALLAHFLTDLVADTSPYGPADGPRLATILVDLVAALVAQAVEADGPCGHALLPRVKDFIRRNLHDPTLTPAQIADRHHISRGYLHRIFQAEGETVAAYIRRNRLEGAHRDLADPAWAGSPIHVVGARWGFPRATDFTRAFRSAYGIAPSERRRMGPRPEPGTPHLSPGG
ncbi:AraC family transcriptional regulator [Asanoa ishikariensis]|uniref:AraC-type DNA-binding protein n=1 Tax=Asanoa ishikariensis TaxID=137265 RepID=A0A1H3UF14_9ACTN|nr:helix-turn-helix domain-containing protein [Asanoa ishikariensis]GIF63675.1 AraC family transcriptional regulator [Asanoa ishikariensis]SDZ61040.1 AraC-type DNA-binding protein [Asanoa ishikariensis]